MHRGWNVREGVECIEGGVYGTLERVECMGHYGQCRCPVNKTGVVAMDTVHIHT